MRSANLLCGDYPLVRMRGRHLDVDDHDVRARELDAPQELRCVLGLSDDVEAGISEETRQSLAQEHRIVGKY